MGMPPFYGYNRRYPAEIREDVGYNAKLTKTEWDNIILVVSVGEKKKPAIERKKIQYE